MINYLSKIYGIRDPTVKLEPLERPKIPVLPEKHPCRGCKLLEWDTGVPYCFLPKCNREIFKLDGGDAKP